MSLTALGQVIINKVAQTLPIQEMRIQGEIIIVVVGVTQATSKKVARAGERQKLIH